MKRIFIATVILSVFVEILIAQTNVGFYNHTVTLKNNESVKIDSTVRVHMKANNLKVDKEVMNSAVIRSFDEKNQFTDLFLKYVNEILQFRNIGYSGISPNNYEDEILSSYHPFEKKSNRITLPFYGGINHDIQSDFQIYYKNLFKNNFSRKILIEKGTEIIVKACKNMPKDFQKNVLIELNLLLRFSYELDNLGEVDTDYLRSYWEGFIYRRNKIDKISTTEIQTTLKKLMNEISSIYTNNQADALIRFDINNEIILLRNSTNFEIKTRTSNKSISLNPLVSINSIQYLKDNTGSFYLFLGEKNNVPFKYLYTSDLTEIMNTEDEANSVYFLSDGGEVIFLEPNINSPIIYTLVKGDKLAIIKESEKNQEYFKVKLSNNIIGYTNKNNFGLPLVAIHSSDEYHYWLLKNIYKKK